MGQNALPSVSKVAHPQSLIQQNLNGHSVANGTGSAEIMPWDYKHSEGGRNFVNGHGAIEQLPADARGDASVKQYVSGHDIADKLAVDDGRNVNKQSVGSGNSGRLVSGLPRMDVADAEGAATMRK